MSVKHLLAFFIILTGFFKVFAWQEPVDTVRLGEVIVIAGHPTLQQRSPVPMQQMLSPNLAIISGASAAEALRNFGGVTIKDYGGIGGLKTVMVRSLGANHTSVMLDGIPLNDAATGQTDLGKIPLINLESITLFVGQPLHLLQPARFYASANVIDIRTKPFSPDENDIKTRAGIRSGSFGIINPFFSTNAEVFKNTNAGINFSYTSAHGEYTFQNPYSSEQQIRTNSDIEAMNTSVYLRHRLKEHSYLQIDAWYYNSERGLPGAVILYNTHTSQRLWNEDFSVNLRYENSHPEKLQMLSLARFSNAWLHYLEKNYLNQQGQLSNTFSQQEYYFSQAFVYPLNSDLKVSMASDLFINSLDSNLPGFAEPLRYSWLTNLGARYERNRLYAQANLLSTLVNDQAQQSQSTATQSALSPSFSLAYRLTSSEPLLRLRFMYKNIFRMPTFNDLYFARVGNPDLRPEYAQQFNLGMMAGYDRNGFLSLSGSADIFYNAVKDKILAIPTQNLFVWSMQNIGKVDIRGLELQLQGQYNPGSSFAAGFFANYTLQRAIDITRDNASWYRHQIPYIPRESFSGGINFEYENFSLGFNSLFNGHRYVLAENIYQNMLPSWWHHDVVAGYQFRTGKTIFQIRFEVNNLLDRQYEVIRSFPMPGRGYFVRVEAGF
ncbi:MAG: TonB-dependent receptor [Bacteroidales bacterium]|nr:TonB-dependent receptor [Bacteroidales bacterium]